MATIRDLIDVKFQDATSYQVFDSTDVMGVVLDYHWGPANQLVVLDREGFNQYFPESIPIGATTVPVDNYYAFAQIKKAFDLGLSRVEVYRINSSSKWPWLQVNVKKSGTPQVVAASATTQFDSSSATAISFSLKYPGYLPQSLASGYENIALKVSITNGVVNVQVCGKLTVNGDAEYYTLEELEGGYVPNQYVEGQPFYLPDVLTARSQYINCLLVDSSVTTLAETVVDFPLYNALIAPSYQASSADDVFDISAVLTGVFSDTEQSSSTLLISSFPSSELDSVIEGVAGQRMDLIAVLGYPVTSTFNLTSIGTAITGMVHEKFAVVVAGRELVQIFGTTIASNCVGGWCGATAKIAKDVRLNQLASARTYGAYAGVLSESLSFSDVLTLHERGVISVYQSTNGPQIFGVRSFNAKQTTYFAKANVMRVIASILKRVFPVCMDAIHTDVAANPISRATFTTSLSSIIQDFIANQNLRPQSEVICSDEINTDVLTKGGTVLNIILNLWFIGLVERVSIKVVATDSSVTAEIV